MSAVGRVFAGSFICVIFGSQSSISFPPSKVTPCRLHHLHYNSMKQIEQSNPKLMMNLYKLMSSVSLKRQEMTIAQLAQFVSIMNPPSTSEPLSRSAL